MCRCIYQPSFTLRYGDAHLHIGGLPSLLGPPTGITPEQLEQQVEREHTHVDDDEWGGSERVFKNKNYRVLTTPSREWEFLTHGVWREVRDQPFGGPAFTAPGAYFWDGQRERWEEDEQKRRKHVTFGLGSLHADLAQRINDGRRT